MSGWTGLRVVYPAHPSTPLILMLTRAVRERIIVRTNTISELGVEEGET